MAWASCGSGGGYTLPAATSSTLGGVISGANITNTSGTLSLTSGNVTSALGFTPIASSGAPVQSVAGQTGAVTNLSAGTATATSGSTARTLAARAADRRNVMDYGADPTGTADSATAFANARGAAQAAGGGMVYVPMGTYLLNSTVYGADNIYFIVDGGVTFTGSGNIQPILDGPSADFGLIIASLMTKTSGEFGIYSSQLVGTTGSTTGYEKAAIYARIRTAAHCAAWSPRCCTGAAHAAAAARHAATPTCRPTGSSPAGWPCGGRGPRRWRALAR